MELDHTPEADRKGDYYLLRAQFLDSLGKIPEAADALNRGMRAAPTRASLYFQAASFLLKHRMRQERLVRITVPYRFARLFGRRGFRWLGQLTFLDDTEFDPEPIQLSLAQVERHGPGLMVDYRHPSSGAQFIAWVE